MSPITPPLHQFKKTLGIINSNFKGLQWTPHILWKVSWYHFSNFHRLQWTKQYACYLFTFSVNWVLIYRIQWTPMVSNDMVETLKNCTSLPALDSNGLYKMSNCCFDLSRDFCYKTPTKMLNCWSPLETILVGVL